jgi:antitoxin MazE
MRTRVQKWGNSLALRIPRSFAQEAGLKEQAAVELSVVDGKLLVVAERRPRYALQDLLAQVTADNLHGEVDTGEAAGGEVW